MMMLQLITFCCEPDSVVNLTKQTPTELLLILKIQIWDGEFAL